MALEVGEGSAARPGRSLPAGKTPILGPHGAGWPQGRSGQVRKISSPPGFDLRIVQPVANRYTDYVTRPTVMVLTQRIIPTDIRIPAICLSWRRNRDKNWNVPAIKSKELNSRHNRQCKYGMFSYDSKGRNHTRFSQLQPHIALTLTSLYFLAVCLVWKAWWWTGLLIRNV